MKSTPAGLYLWAVHLHNGGGQQLWITTPKADVALAARKTRSFMKRFRVQHGHPRAAVVSIESHGTIDA